MAPKKAGKKAAKKGAKKGAHQHGGHEIEKDLRRAYEHLGRLDALRPGVPKTVLGQIEVLTELGRVSLMAGDTRSSAELLRACEHLAFGALASNAKDELSEALQDAIVAQYERLLEKAADRWDDHEEEPGEAITEAYERTLVAAESAYTKGAYRKALELVRAAEAMAHADVGRGLGLEEGDGRKTKKLKG